MHHEIRETDKYVFFWNGEFSNWYPCRYKNIRYKGLTFFNSEQAFMWEKAVHFGDMETAGQIIKDPDPSRCKKLGRLVKGFDPQKWSEVSYDIMIAVNYAKFSQNHILKNVLLETEDKILVEASPYDTIWGIGLHWEDEKCDDPANWKGQNLLGKALMVVRNKIKSESK